MLATNLFVSSMLDTLNLILVFTMTHTCIEALITQELVSHQLNICSNNFLMKKSVVQFNRVNTKTTILVCSALLVHSYSYLNKLVVCIQQEVSLTSIYFLKSWILLSIISSAKVHVKCEKLNPSACIELSACYSLLTYWMYVCTVDFKHSWLIEH